jgi:uncharacterized protein (DUF1810 family)
MKAADRAAGSKMSILKDPFDLQRFVSAQNPVYDQVCTELRAGRKEGHWMWFVFPQLRGLGHSAMATKFGIASASCRETHTWIIWSSGRHCGSVPGW